MRLLDGVLDDPARLDGIFLFSGLTAEQLSRNNRRLRYTRLSAGSSLMWEEERGDALLLVVTGSVKIQVTQSDGSIITMHQEPAGSPCP